MSLYRYPAKRRPWVAFNTDIGTQIRNGVRPWVWVYLRRDRARHIRAWIAMLIINPRLPPDEGGYYNGWRAWDFRLQAGVPSFQTHHRPGGEVV